MGCNYLNGVLCYFVGVLHIGLLAHFRSSVTATAWVGALYSANMSLTGREGLMLLCLCHVSLYSTDISLTGSEGLAFVVFVLRGVVVCQHVSHE